MLSLFSLSSVERLKSEKKIIIDGSRFIALFPSSYIFTACARERKRNIQSAVYDVYLG
jgi:hypothetical protein